MNPSSTATRTDKHLEARERYISAFASLVEAEREAGREASWLHALRVQAMARFRELGFPTLKDEGWRQTDLSALIGLSGATSSSYQLNGLAHGGIEKFTVQGLEGPRLVWLNGHFAPELSQLKTLPQGVVVGSLSEAIAQDNATVRAHLGQHASFEKNAFTALNTAFMQDGAWVQVPSGVVVEEPIHLMFLTTAGETITVAHPRSLFVVGKGAQVTIIEHYAGASGAVYWNNAVTEVVAQAGSVVDHYKVQMESTQAFHMATMQVMQERACNFSSLSIAFGGKLARSHANAVMQEPHIECTLNGLYLIGGNQQVDNETLMDHAAPNCNSHEVYTGILNDAAKGVFSGKIFVRQIAQKTDAKQTNRNLLLSPDAVVDTKPQLEIFADDVKCTHGATIGQLDEDALFYLRARGIGQAEARAMLILAFASAVTEAVKVEPLRAMLNQELFARLNR